MQQQLPIECNEWNLGNVGQVRECVAKEIPENSQILRMEVLTQELRNSLAR
jgi:hypothetical protein